MVNGVFQTLHKQSSFLTFMFSVPRRAALVSSVDVFCVDADIVSMIPADVAMQPQTTQELVKIRRVQVNGGDWMLEHVVGVFNKSISILTHRFQEINHIKIFYK